MNSQNYKQFSIKMHLNNLIRTTTEKRRIQAYLVCYTIILFVTNDVCKLPNCFWFSFRYWLSDRSSLNIISNTLLCFIFVLNIPLRIINALHSTIIPNRIKIEWKEFLSLWHVVNGVNFFLSDFHFVSFLISFF